MNESTVIALGFFDGVHRGHGALLKMAVRRAQERGCRSAAFTFDRSPREFVTGKPVPLLTTPSERANIIRTQYGVQEVFVEPFDRNMMTMPWEDFISELLVRKYHAVHLVAGHDFRFGHKNEGDVEKLRSYCAAHGLGCDIIPRVEKDGVTVSSTYIRSLLEAGEVRRAAEFLGHYFSVEGTVRHGEGIGKKSLFPTANLIPEEHIIALKRGVYATRAHLPNGETCVGVTNVGVRPTVSDKNTVTIETYLVGFDGDLYGQKLQLDFFDYLREEKKFSSTQELHDMIAKNAGSFQNCRFFFLRVYFPTGFFFPLVYNNPRHNKSTHREGTGCEGDRAAQKQGMVRKGHRLRAALCALVRAGGGAGLRRLRAARARHDRRIGRRIAGGERADRRVGGRCAVSAVFART